MVTAGVASEFYIKAVDHVRSASPGLCDASGSVATGCRFRYALASHIESGFNMSFHEYRAMLDQVPS